MSTKRSAATAVPVIGSAASSRAWLAWARSSVLLFPDHHDTGVPQSQKLLGIRQPEPARRMERLGHIRNLASGTDAERPAATNDHEIVTPWFRVASESRCV